MPAYSVGMLDLSSVEIRYHVCFATVGMLT